MNTRSALGDRTDLPKGSVSVYASNAVKSTFCRLPKGETTHRMSRFSSRCALLRKKESPSGCAIHFLTARSSVATVRAQLDKSLHRLRRRSAAPVRFKLHWTLQLHCIARKTIWVRFQAFLAPNFFRKVGYTFRQYINYCVSSRRPSCSQNYYAKICAWRHDVYDVCIFILWMIHPNGCKFNFERNLSLCNIGLLVANWQCSRMSQKPASVAKSSSRGAVSKGGGAKNKGNFISRQARTKKTVTEAELLKKQSISPDDVLGLETATEGILKWEEEALIRVADCGCTNQIR